jgi:hypothetical protein
MPACAVAESKDWCIEDVRIYRDGQSPVSAIFREPVTDQTTPAVKSRAIPAGGHVSLWEAAPDAGFPNLRVAAVVQAKFVNYGFKGPDYSVQDFNIQLIPYVLDSSPNYRLLETFDAPELEAGIVGVRGVSTGCVWERTGECGKRIDSPESVRYGITVRSAAGVGEFFNGRLKDPTLSVEKTGGITQIQVDASPVTVGEFGMQYVKTAALEQKMPFLRENLSIAAYFPDAAKVIEGFRELAGDRASGENTVWRLTAATLGGTNQCYEKYGVAGLVTTNATTYGAEPPRLENGSLNYNVAGMHYLSNGTDLFVGTYDLVIKSEVARCLYGFTKAPVSATVTVVGADGAENIATTVVSEKDGWLKLAAYGFTFSEKEIKVKITQPQTRTLTNYLGRATALTAKQKAEIKATVTKGAGNSKFICTGIRLVGQPAAQNALVRQRAKLACDYAKSLNPKLSTFFQTKTTQARSFNGRVLVVSK